MRLKGLWRTERLTHGTLTREFWLMEFWRRVAYDAETLGVISDAQNFDAFIFLMIFDALNFDADEFWRTFLGGDFWRIYLGDDFWRIFGGWFLTHFSFVHGIWRTFWGVIFGGSIEALCFLGWLTQNTFCMHFDLVCFSVYVKFKVYATLFCIFEHPFSVLEWPILICQLFPSSILFCICEV